MLGVEDVAVAQQILRQENAGRDISVIGEFPEVPSQRDAPFCLAALHRLQEGSTLAPTLDRFLADSEPSGDFFLGTLQGTQPFQLRCINFHRRSSKHLTLAFAILKTLSAESGAVAAACRLSHGRGLPCYGPIHAFTTARSARTVSKLRPSSSVAVLLVNCCQRKIAWST